MFTIYYTEGVSSALIKYKDAKSLSIGKILLVVVELDNYKLFDTTDLFYNIKKDPFEQSPIPDSKLTPAQKQIKANFEQVLSTMHN